MPPNFLTWFLQNSLLVSRQATAPSDGAILAQDTFGMFLGNCLPSQLKTQVRKLVFGPPRILFWKKKKVPLSLLAYLIHKKSFRINYAYFFLKKKKSNPPPEGGWLASWWLPEKSNVGNWKQYYHDTVTAYVHTPTTAAGDHRTHSLAGFGSNIGKSIPAIISDLKIILVVISSKPLESSFSLVLEKGIHRMVMVANAVIPELGRMNMY